MTEPRNNAHHTKAYRERTYHDVISAKGGAGPAEAGRTAYREEYQRDYGPDLDESLDGNESGREF